MHRLPRLHLLKSKNSRSIFKQACERFDLVYFGSVSQHSDDHQMVRGFTLSPSHVDRHYCVGTVSGVDVILLERMDTISFPDKPSRAFTWTVLQIDLTTRLPAHMLLNSHRYDDIVYAHLFTKFHDLKQYAPHNFADHDHKFAETFAVYAPLQHIDDVMTVRTPDTTAVLGHHYGRFDYEAYGDRLIVYAAGSNPTAHTIEEMFQSGLWLAMQLDPRLAQLAATRRDGNMPPLTQ